MERISRVIGPARTNVHLIADARSREAIAIDTAIPSLDAIVGDLRSNGWTLKLIVTTHGHWDHFGDNAAVAAETGAPIAVHALDAHRLTDPTPLWAPFDIPPCVPAIDLAEGGEIRFGAVRLTVLHTPGHTEGSVCLWAADDGLLFSGDTLFAGGWGRVDLPGASPEQMVDSLARLATFDDPLAVLPGHGRSTTIGAERPWLEMVVRERRLLL